VSIKIASFFGEKSFGHLHNTFSLQNDTDNGENECNGNCPLLSGQYMHQASPKDEVPMGQYTSLNSECKISWSYVSTKGTLYRIWYNIDIADLEIS